jgi:putative spermidine/putrescine transport system ATP-binding protein
MHGLELQGITKTFGNVRAVEEVEVLLPFGKLVCFLGPSGCGKTTLLRLIAGLEIPTAGCILLDGEDLTGVPAHRRNFGMVFQSLALFPHLTVAENIAYGLRIRGVRKEEQRRRARELLDLVRLPELEDRHISQLSGGQRQRIAMARALALEPKLFLLDEPLSALDAKLREEMQVELRLLQQRLGITTVMVTHDQREAMTMADLILVMSEGRVQQMGAPLEIYRNPANRFVADFIGTSNLITGTIADRTAVKVGEVAIKVTNMPTGLPPGAEITLSVRPEDVSVYAGTRTGENHLTGEVAFVRDVGVSIETYVECNGHTIVAHAAPKDRPDIAKGEAVTIELPAEACVLLTR